MGNRACVWASGTDNINMYMGMAGGGGDDCDYEYTYRRGVGMKISPTFDTNVFTEALKVVGTANVTSDLTVGGTLNGNDMNFQDATSSAQSQIDTLNSSVSTNTTDIAANVTDIATSASDIATNVTDIAMNATDIATNATDIATNATDIATNATDIATNVTDIANRLQLAGGTMTGSLVVNDSVSFGSSASDTCTISSSIYAPAANSFMRNTAGVYLLSGSAGSYYNIPIYHSTADLINNIYEQQYTSGTTGYSSQSGAALGSWSNIDLDNSQDVFIVHPNYGVIVYNDTGYTNEIMNFKNTSNGPQVVKCTTDNTASSIKVYYDDAIVVGL